MRKYLATILFSIVAMLLSLFMAYTLSEKPEISSYKPYSSAYFDNEGKLLRLTLAKDERYRVYARLGDISSEFIEATVLYEDQHYYQHIGIDPLALIRAFWTTYITKERRIGASTIVMQLARLRWDIPSNTIAGKFHQIARALQISRHYTKDEILEAYLNLTPYGRNIEGIAAASLIYFNKKPSELSFLEAITLAVIPQNPNKRNPTTKKGYNNLLTARKILFERWITYHPTYKDKAKYLDLALAIRPPENLPFQAPHFINYVEQQIRSQRRGYINTTLNLNKQLSVENVLRTYINANQAIGIHNASALLVNHQTLAIEAMVGSADFNLDAIYGQVNGTTAKRSPGSALKPFVYALAMDEGLIHPLSLLKDSPRKFGGFTPENYDKQFLGPISAKDALIQSRNVPAVHLQSQLSKTSFYQFLVRAGIKKLKEEKHYGLALALGGGEVTALELAKLYAMLGNGGMHNELLSLKGLNRLKKSSYKTSKRLLSSEASYLTLDMLKKNPAPDSLDIKLDRYNEVAWKTGTSWAFRDAWAVGISGPYVLIVWVGNFDGKGNDSFVGRSAAGPLFFRILNSLFPPQNWSFEQAYSPENMNLKRLKVCAKTGDLYQKNCPTAIESWFIPGVSPIKVSNIYRKIPINIKTGKRACWHKKGKTNLTVYEFWPSDFIEIYSMAGISLKSPPKFEGECDLDQTSATGLTPVITSPQSSIDYVFRLNSDSDNKIPLQAIVDRDVEKLHWFIDDGFVGTVGTGEAILWHAKPGVFNLTVVDDSGRSTSKSFNVISIN